MNPYHNPGFGLFATFLAGVLLVGGWLALSDPTLARALLASRSGADWLLLAGLVAGALVLVGLGTTLWAAGARVVASLVKLAAVAVLVLAVITLAAPAGSPGASSALNRLQDLLDRFAARGPAPVLSAPAPAPGAAPASAAAAPTPGPQRQPVNWWQTP